VLDQISSSVRSVISSEVEKVCWLSTLLKLAHFLDFARNDTAREDCWISSQNLNHFWSNTYIITSCNKKKNKNIKFCNPSRIIICSK